MLVSKALVLNVSLSTCQHSTTNSITVTPHARVQVRQHCGALLRPARLALAPASLLACLPDLVLEVSWCLVICTDGRSAAL